MVGARKYTQCFEGTTQHERLVLVSGSHARGKTFRIYILPLGEAAKLNGQGNPPLNKNAILVYGITSGNFGWTERYGWLHHGPWKADFLRLVAKVQQKQLEEIEKYTDIADRKKEEQEARKQELLASYM